MSIDKLVRHDIRCGLFRLRLLWVILFWLIPCLMFLDVLEAYGEAGKWLDYMLYIFKGMEPIENASSMEQVRLPILWLAVMGGNLLLSLDYFLSDLTSSGQQILVRCNSRRKWFLSKCLWNIAHSMAYFIIGMVVVTVIAVLGGSKLSLQYSNKLIGDLFFLASPVAMNTWECVSIAIVLPMLSMVVLNLVQMTLCIAIRPVFSFLACLCFLVIGVFWPSPLAVGNGAMAIRSSILGSSIEPAYILLICLAVLAVCVIAGAVAFQRNDILGMEESQ